MNEFMDEIINRPRKEKRLTSAEENARSCVFVSFFTWEIWVILPGQGYSSCKNRATQSYQCVQYFCVSKQWYAVFSVSTQWYAVFSCVQTMVWLPVFGGLNMCTDVDACNCTQMQLYTEVLRIQSTIPNPTSMCSIFMCPKQSCIAVRYFHVSKTVSGCAVFSCVQNNMRLCSIFMCPKQYEAVRYFHVS